MKTSPSIAVYCRVSTGEQSCALQKRDLKQYASARGWRRIKVFEDHGKTGTSANRPQLQTMLAEIREGHFDVVLCWKMDRLFRSLKDLVVTLQEFQERGVSFVSLKDHVDLSTSPGRLMMQIIGAFGEFEASLIKERVRAGLANARARGKRLGRPKIRDDSKIIRLRQQGYSFRGIAHALKISKGSVQQCLSRRRGVKSRVLA